MRFKTILILLLGIAIGGGVAVGFLSTPGGEGEKSAPAKSERPSWMASPQEVAKALGQTVVKEEKDRALIVGVIGPETGSESEYGLAVLDGITMAAERYNTQGGLSGKKIEIIHYDNNGGSGQALDMATALINKNVAAIFSAPTGWSTFAPTSLANGTKTVFISVGTRRKIGRSGAYVFHFSLPDEIAISEMLSHAATDLGYRNFALVTSSSYDYSLSLAAVFKQAVPKHGGRILVEADTYDTFTGKTDIAKVVADLKPAAKDLQAIIFTGGSEEAARLLRAAHEAGLRLPLIGGEDLFSEQFLRQSGQAARGALLYATFAPDRASRQVTDFVSDHVALRKAVPGRFTALAYDAFGLFTRALEAAGSLKSPAIREALVNLKETEGVTGASRWAEDGTPIKHPHLYRVQSTQTGEQFVLVEAKASKQ